MAVKKVNVEKGRTLANQMLDSSRRVWLAGLGSVAWARIETAKVFENLVKEGEKVEVETRESLKGTAKQTRASVAKTKAEAGKRFNRLERLFQRRVEGVLHRMGVPTAHDVSELSDRVSKLNKSMTALAPEK